MYVFLTSILDIHASSKHNFIVYLIQVAPENAVNKTTMSTVYADLQNSTRKTLIYYEQQDTNQASTQDLKGLIPNKDTKANKHTKQGDELFYILHFRRRTCM